MKQKFTSVHFFFVLVLAVMMAVIGFAVYQGSRPSSFDDFAQCLTTKGAKLYGAWWCPNCENQKKDFGNAFSFLDYQECSSPGKKDQLPVCKEAGITSYPTWRFADGSEQVGRTDLETLSEKTGCVLPTLEK